MKAFGAASEPFMLGKRLWAAAFATILVAVLLSLLSLAAPTDKAHADEAYAPAQADFDAAANPNAMGAQASQGAQSMYRLYNPYTGEHFYTGNADERSNLVDLGWYNEGMGWTAPTSSDTPVYRLYNPNAGDHHYTPDASERDTLTAVGWKDEGVGWYSDDAQSVPLYRQYNPYALTGTHNYTTSQTENNDLAAVGWVEEGVGWYGIVTDPAALDEDALRIAVDAHASNGILYFYYADYDADGVKEAFAITGRRDNSSYGFDWATDSGELWYVDAYGNVTLVGSGYNGVGSLTNGLAWDYHDTGYGFLVLEKYAGGSGSSSLVFGLRNGYPTEVTFDIGLVGMLHNDDAGWLSAYTSYFGNGYHQFIDHVFAFAKDAFQFVEAWAGAPRDRF